MAQYELNEQRRKSGKYWCMFCDDEPSLLFESEQKAREVTRKFKEQFPHGNFEYRNEW